MDNFFCKNSHLYPKPEDIQPMNTQMGSPFSMRSGGYLLMSSPYESYKCDNAENIDPQFLMPLSSDYSSSGDNFSSSSGSNRVRYRGDYDCSPLSMVENYGNSTSSSANKSPTVFTNAPLSMEDDVLVMDEVFVMNAKGGRSRPGKDSSGVSSSSAPSYKMDVGKGSSGSSASSVQSYKMDFCSSWAETGSCRFGSSCQFLHKKEEAGMARLLNKGKPELEICFPQSPFAKSSLSSFKGHNSRPAMSRGTVHRTSPQGSYTVGNYRGSLVDGSGSRGSHCSSVSRDTLSPMPHLDWMPQDDDIDARLPGSASDNPSRYEVCAYINNYLYAPRVKNRLPIFTSICPDNPAEPAHLPQISPNLI